MIETIGLTKQYDDGTVALDQLDLTVEAGEVYCLLGANGAGKTTTINLLLGFIAPSSGAARINGVDVTNDPVEAKRHVALLSETAMLYANLTAVQNLRFFVELSGNPSANRVELEQILVDVGLPFEALHRRVREFSKGMRQKLAIAIATQKSSAVALLLDEPFSGLDPMASSELVKTIQKLKSEGKSVLMSTHNVFRAKELADRVGIMRDGTRLLERTREEVANEDLEQLYISTMQ